MAIPLVDLKAQYISIQKEIDAAISRVLARADFIHGREVAQFEEEFAAYCGVKEAVGVASGTEALRLALLACGIGEGDEVITTPFTFIATASAISQVGATPVFVDIDPLTRNLDPHRIEAAITERTRAILPVHLYGNPAEMDPICKLAARFGLKIVEDAAQAHGALYHGRRVGSIGDVACFSFYPAKPLGAYGDAGIVVTDDPQISDMVRLLRDHGRKGKYEHLMLGSNSRLDTLQAAILRVKLQRLDEWNERRRTIASMYRELLSHVPDLLLPVQDSSSEAVYHLFVIGSTKREYLRRSLGATDIATGIHYPIPLHLQPAYRHLGFQVGSFPEAERAASEVLSLPIYPELSDNQVHKIAEATSLTLSAVGRHLNSVEQRQWMDNRRPNGSRSIPKSPADPQFNSPVTVRHPAGKESR